MIHAHERVDDLHRNGYRIIQDPGGFCFGMDAVILSGFARVNRGEDVLDLGTGTGVIPILLEAKTEGRTFTGLEIQPNAADMARRSVLLNGLDDKIKIIEGDIKDCATLFEHGSFAAVTANPPYMNSGGGLVNPNGGMAAARHELLCTLEDVICAASAVLKVGGRFYMVHRPHRLVDILTLLRARKLEPKRLRFVHPRKDRPPNLVLIESVKGGKPLLKTEPPLIVYNSEGLYTQELIEIYNG